MNSDQVEDLADYVQKVVKEQGIGYREIERRAERKGFIITHGYISRIISRAATNPSVEKLRALAAGLGRPEEEVFAVARGENLKESQINDAVASSMLFKYSKLSDKDKKELATLMKALDREIEERLQKQNK